jgi:dipeptide/tripeptide permease
MASDLGAVIGPVVAGALAEHVGYGAAFVSTAVVLSIGLAMAIRMPETVHRCHVAPDMPEFGMRGAQEDDEDPASSAPASSAPATARNEASNP